MTTTLSTIGYEGASLEDFLDTLLCAGIRQVIDIRDVPVSRRPGFSKNILMRALEEEEIKYIHLKPLGDPKPGREAAREGRFDDFNIIYSSHLALPAGQEALQLAVESAKATPSVLLCYERDYKYCHRTLVAAAMTELSCFQIRNLGVQKKARQVRVEGKNARKPTGAVPLTQA
jgi:uncharacterized protein (DUF488 family)